MRRVRGIAIITLSVLLISVGLATPAAAAPDGGYEHGTGVYAAAMSEGHNGVPLSFPDCDWKDVWQRSLWQRIVDGIRAIAARLAGRPPANFQEAELVLDPLATENNLFAEGALARILNRDPSTVVSYEGSEVNFIHKLVVAFTGSETVGRFKPITDADDSLHNNASYPQIQRGTYQTPSGGTEDLWWDPYYVTVDEPGPDGSTDCPPGLFYSPRNSDPVTLIPDLRDYMHTLLADPEAKLEPVDRIGDWAYVQVPINFSTIGASLDPVEATAHVRDIASGGSVWAHAVANPTYVMFISGDGDDKVVCDIPDAELPYDPADPGNCSYTYLNSSNTQPGGVFNATLAIGWEGTLTASNTTSGQTFPVPATVVELDVAVAEARPAVSVRP